MKYGLGVLGYGIIGRPFDKRVIDLLSKERQRPNVILILVTSGGDADAAFRIARSLQRSYKQFSCFVSGYCKSAGTLIAVGANELIICDHGELGPLDVQMYKKDELGEMESGAAVQTALTTLFDQAFLAFEQFFLETMKRSGTFTVQTGARIATDLASGLLAPVFQQIDPLHVGETGRAMSVAYHYGSILQVSPILAFLSTQSQERQVPEDVESEEGTDENETEPESGPNAFAPEAGAEPLPSSPEHAQGAGPE